MRKLKVLTASVIAIAAVTGLVWASNIPLVTGPLEPANLVKHINDLTQRINNGVSGNVAVLTTAYTTSTTSAETALSGTLLANQMAVGQTVHYWASGVNSADANAKTVTFAFGAATCAVTVTASGAKWTAEAWFTIQAAAVEASTCKGQQAATAITVTQGTGSVSTAAPVTATVQLTAATSGTTEALQAEIDVQR